MRGICWWNRIFQTWTTIFWEGFGAADVVCVLLPIQNVYQFLRQLLLTRSHFQIKYNRVSVLRWVGKKHAKWIYFCIFRWLEINGDGHFRWASLQFNYQLAFEGFQFQAIQFVFKIKWLCKTKKSIIKRIAWIAYMNVS